MDENILFAGVLGLPGDETQGGNGAANGNGAENGAATGGATGTGTTQQVTPTDDAAPPSMMPMLLIWVLVFAALWFFMIRPQRKREKKLRELQAQITTGDNVITTAGFFGKVADIGEDCFIVEFGTNRGIRIPVLKADVVAVRSPKMTPQAQTEVSEKE